MSAKTPVNIVRTHYEIEEFNAGNSAGWIRTSLAPTPFNTTAGYCSVPLETWSAYVAYLNIREQGDPSGKPTQYRLTKWTVTQKSEVIDV